MTYLLFIEVHKEIYWWNDEREMWVGLRDLATKVPQQKLEQIKASASKYTKLPIETEKI